MSFNFRSDGDSPYGSWTNLAEIELEENGYYVLVGANSSGKTSLQQGLYRNNGDAILIPSERSIVIDNINPIESLSNAQNVLRETLRHHPVDIMEFATGSLREYSQKLPNLLINSAGILSSVPQLNVELADFGMPSVEIQGEGAQWVMLGGRKITQHGSGARTLLTILAALVHPRINPVIIDEPENSLEPLAQKLLRDKLLEYGKRKTIIVATHSHLFLNRKAGQLSHNFRVTKEDGVSQVAPLHDERDLQEVVFTLLGNSVEDLFLPTNYLIVEGPSDQVIVQKVLELVDQTDKVVQVVSAGGITNVANKFSAVCEQALPLVMGTSPYKSRVTCLIDKCDESDGGQARAVTELKRELGDRLLELDDPTIEEYMHDDIYRAAGLNKAEKLAEIEAIKQASMTKENKKIAIDKVKKDISLAISANLVEEHLTRISKITDAVKKALNS
jgi:predicted ATP-dependent endonuclease of OLD family